VGNLDFQKIVPTTVLMAGYKMPAQFTIGAKRTLQIDERTGLGELQIRPPPGFLQHIELKQLEFSTRGNFHHRQAAAVHRHARAQLDSARDSARPHDERDRFPGWLDRLDHARFFDDACEHEINLMAGWDSVEPRLIHPRRQQQILAEPAPLNVAKLDDFAQTFCAVTRDTLCGNHDRPKFSARKKMPRVAQNRRAKTTHSPRRRLRQ